MSEDWVPRWFRRGWPFFKGFRADDFFRETEEIMQKEFEQLSKRAPEDLIREQVLPDGSIVKSWGPFVYGYSVTVGADGKPQIREFGNVKPQTKLGRPSIGIKDQREPLIETLDSADEIKVIAELPGVEKETIKLHGTANILSISVDTPGRKYHKEVELPTEIDLEQVKSTYKNGVLEVTLKKKRKEEKPKGKELKID